ncbi:hypothetical protein FFLO_00849 [Filobasidium floriforme]|uniref:YTH domain-containing protein n=1 Tax=Filobasidium floriforme TaxID=5210 RepID=A0A8K0JQN8_9TREE|nr:YT521-B-like domain-containing protein [Filobasidium floriforme]KAG7571176.1 hypothetical protein FFLO_00849 [Filobasidium floriforme]KAH8087015.1 YT521-B-like domain-containing protein [Filobasidium floriforme]
MVLGSPPATKHDLPQRPAPGSPDQEDRRAAGRKHYHPAAPANRSEWVMWIGNVPNNATHEEMWKFLNQPIPREAVPQSIPYKEHIKISSIFLISRSSCAFVNLETQDELLLAISYFNHRLLRPLDPRCPKLVCRVRKMDDDLKAGVGGQRGAGLHTKYVQDLLAQQKAEAASEAKAAQDGTKTPESETPLSPAAMEYPPDMVTPAAFAAWHRERSQSGTHSFASTNSSFLGRHFPKRYFILKSLTQEELETSIKTGKWKTQLHNEAILDQAFRTSPEVYLIFGANKQGNFYGWAIMRSGIGSLARNARSISCGSRSQLPTTPSSGTVNSGGTAERSSGSTSQSTDDPAMTRSGRPRIPHASSDTFRMTTQSPGELSPSEEVNYSAMRLPDVASQTRPPIRLASVPESESRSNTLDADALAQIRAAQDSGFKLDNRAPSRAAERRSNSTGSQGSNPDKAESIKPDASDDKPDGDGIIRHDMVDPVSSDVAQAVDASGPGPAENQLAKIGTVFDVEWVKTGVLPFHRLRHLRNPWNQDKEVKVSRDGTELEPTVGALLLAEWDKLESTAPTS